MRIRMLRSRARRSNTLCGLGFEDVVRAKGGSCSDRNSERMFVSSEGMLESSTASRVHYCTLCITELHMWIVHRVRSHHLSSQVSMATTES